MPERQARSRRPAFSIFLYVLYVVSFAVIGYYLVTGSSYYQTPYKERPRQEEYRSLRPAGPTGHGFGVVGSAMMIFMLAYSVRKRSRRLAKWGPLRRWLDIHIYFGIIGPLLIVLHTSFKVQGLVAVSFWSMVAVVASGVLGRYLYLKIPRNIQGDELGRVDIERMNTILGNQLAEASSGARVVFDKLETALAPKVHEDTGPVAALAAVLKDDIFRPIRKHRARKLLASELELPARTRDNVIALVSEKAMMHRKLILLNKIQQLFHYWHVFHKPFAIVMYVIMAIHIGIAIWLGYTWIF